MADALAQGEKFAGPLLTIILIVLGVYIGKKMWDKDKEK